MMSPDGRVQVGSVAKTLLATGVLRLVTLGRIDLDAPLARYLPEVPIDNRWESEAPLRVRHLLDHTSGLDPEQQLAFFVAVNSDPEDGRFDRVEVLLVDALGLTSPSLQPFQAPGIDPSKWEGFNRLRPNRFEQFAYLDELAGVTRAMGLLQWYAVLAAWGLAPLVLCRREAGSGYMASSPVGQRQRQPHPARVSRTGRFGSTADVA